MARPIKVKRMAWRVRSPADGRAPWRAIGAEDLMLTVGQLANKERYSVARRAGKRDVFVQPDDRRIVVRGPKGREHIIESNGELVTSVNRFDAAHRGRVRGGTIRPATDEEFQKLKDFLQ